MYNQSEFICSEVTVYMFYTVKPCWYRPVIQFELLSL